MGKKRKELSHSEVWDDSALLQSWDDALEEYKLYHSIHARGEHVEDVIKDFDENADVAIRNDNRLFEHSIQPEINGTNSDDLEDGELEEDNENAVAGEDAHLVNQSQNQATPKEQSYAHPQSSSGVPPAGMANAADVITSSVQDEGLKNLMMSWYYAGYYTGLYQGQQQASGTAPK